MEHKDSAAIAAVVTLFLKEQCEATAELFDDDAERCKQLGQLESELRLGMGSTT